LETGENQQKPGIYFDILLMLESPHESHVIVVNLEKSELTMNIDNQFFIISMIYYQLIIISLYQCIHTKLTFTVQGFDSDLRAVSTQFEQRSER